MQLGSEGYDGFVILVGLFLVLLVENLWSFDPTTFSSAAAGDLFLGLLVAGAAFGLFTIFSITVIKLKVQRLLARDILAMYLHHQSTLDYTERCTTRPSQLDRLEKRWTEAAAENSLTANRDDLAACFTSEWYYGARDDHKSGWDPCRPRTLVTFAALSFVAMITTSVAALAVLLRDTKGVRWSVWSCVGVGSAILFPGIFIKISVRKPPGVSASQKNPFVGLG